MYLFIGRNCNGNWVTLRTLNSAFVSVSTTSNTCLNYPNNDIVATEDSGKSI
jgi:hypothetical protein